MSRDISVALKSHLAGETTTVCTCWKVTRQDSTVFAFTDHDRDLVIDGVTYKAASGYTASNVVTTAALDIDNLNIDGLLSDDSITEDDLRAGLWDFAAIEIFVLNWADLTQGKLVQRTGHLGEVTINRGTFTAELRGLTQAYSRVIIEVTTPGCRADLGDERCGVDLGPLTVTGTITSVDADEVTLGDTSRTEAGPVAATDTTPAVAGYFDFGLLTMTSGANDGFSMEIKSYDVGVFVLQLPVPYAVTVGDTYSATPGCDKALATCRDKYDNVVRFRGEPWSAGTDALLQIGRPDA
jgi:uncharacterized phage protein (TIGR02218 family)